MTPNTFQKYYQSQTAKITEYYTAARKYVDVESIHDMRVEIKKLRSFFNLVEWINTDFPTKKIVSPIIKLFKSAGRIRDVHVQQQLTRYWIKESNLEISEYYNHLKSAETKKQSQFTTACKKFDIKIFDKIWVEIETALQILPQNFIQFKSEERFYILINDLIGFKNKPEFSAEDYHKIRILSKETRYALEILQQCFQVVDQLAELDLKIRDVHRALGKWHDDEVELQMLKYFLENSPTQQFFNKSSYSRFIEILEKDKIEWLSKFEKRWRVFTEFLAREGLRSLKNSTDFEETKFSLN